MVEAAQKARILFVEDESTLREHLAVQLADEYEIETAADGEAALKAVIRKRPDLIVTDLVMPTLDGVELVRLLRDTPSTSMIPILMLSGHAPDELRLKGFEVGADAFLRKPYSELELRVRIRSLLRTTRLRTESARAEVRERIELEAVAERAALLESISDAFYAVDQDWRFTYINQKALDYFGVRREEVMGRDLWQSFPIANDTRLQDEYRHAMRLREKRDLEILSPHSGRWVEIHVYPTPQGIAINFRDITDRKQAEAALRTLTHTLEERVQAAIMERDQAWNNTQDLLAVIAEDGTLRAANPAWTSLLGWQVHEVEGNNYRHFLHPDDVDEAARKLQHALELPLQNFETRLRTKSGVFRWVSWSAARRGDYVYASGRDVTTEKEALQALREADARTRTVFETSYQYQGYLSTEGRLLDANRTSLASIQAELRDVIGKPLWETPWFTSTPHVVEEIKKDLSRVQQGENIRREITLNLPVGQRTLDFSMRPVLDEEGLVIGIVPEAMDVTERKRSAEQLAHMQKFETIGQITGNVAHDFNNLLTPIVGALDILQRKYATDERSRRLTDGAAQAAERARTLVQKLLAFARKQHLEATAVDIAKLLSSIANLLARSIGPRIQVCIDVEPDLPPAHVDANQLELALLNLALNARDAMPDGGLLEITACSAMDLVEIAVIDSGIGMDEQTMKRSIDPFFTTKPSGQGTGLGLSMVHGLAAQSGGELVLESTPCQGTTARLRLPISGETVDLSEREDPKPSSLADRFTLLLVDDEELVRSSTAAMLEDVGYRVIEAHSATEALKCFDKHPEVRVVITDYAMPGMTGIELARAIREHRAGIPILVITGFAESQRQ